MHGEAVRQLHVESADAPSGSYARTPEPEVILDEQFLRRCAWQIGERRPHETFVCPDNYVALSVVTPGQAFIVWRVQQSWIDHLARSKGGAWNGARFVVRFYEVTRLVFNGLNAHRMRDVTVDGLAGERLFELPLAGTTQLAEVGFLLRSGEFVAAARSPVAHFPSLNVSGQTDYAALYVDDRLAPEPVPSPWEGAAYVRERSKPRLRNHLRIAVLSFESEVTGQQGTVPKFVSSLARELGAQGQEVHAFVPACDGFREIREVAGVSYRPVFVEGEGPVERALSFTRAVEAQLHNLPPFDLFHMQEWMTALMPWMGTRPTTLALTSTEHTRRDGTLATPLSLEIEKLEREAARASECVLVPAGVREKVLASLGMDGGHVHAFPIEGRAPDPWEVPIDAGQVKREIGFGPLDRVLTFVGPLENGAGPDLLIEAISAVMGRVPQLRLACVGCGGLHGTIQARAQQLGLGHAVRLLGHVEEPRLIRILRASEALVLPSRQRVNNDEGVVGLARRAHLAVLTTHGGPAHLIKHEENGLVAYDNPPSLVWGLNRLLDDRRHTEEMGHAGGRPGEGACWANVARRYAELCAENFIELTEGADPERRWLGR
jgi:glycosyltransferase involved in cell wall biosynthesis